MSLYGKRARKCLSFLYCQLFCFTLKTSLSSHDFCLQAAISSLGVLQRSWSHFTRAALFADSIHIRTVYFRWGIVTLSTSEVLVPQPSDMNVLLSSANSWWHLFFPCDTQLQSYAHRLLCADKLNAIVKAHTLHTTCLCLWLHACF